MKCIYKWLICLSCIIIYSKAAKVKTCSDTCQYCCVDEVCKPKHECTDSLVYILLVLLGVTFCVGVLLVLVCYLRLFENEHKFKKAFHSHTKIDFDQFKAPSEKRTETTGCLFKKKVARNQVVDVSFISTEFPTSGASFKGRNRIISRLYAPIESIWKIGRQYSQSNILESIFFCLFLVYEQGPESITKYMDGKDSIQIDIEEDSSDNRINIKREYLDDSVMNLVDKRNEKRDSLKMNSFLSHELRRGTNFRTIEQEHQELSHNKNNSAYSTLGDRQEATTINVLTTIGTVRRIKQKDINKLDKINEDPNYNESLE